MTITPAKKKDAPAINGAAAPAAPPAEAAPAVHPLLARPIPHAYALVPVAGKPGLYYAVHLEGVVAEKLEHLEPSGRPAHAPYGMMRISGAMEKRHLQKKWGKA